MALEDEVRLYVEEEYGAQLHHCSSSFIYDNVVKFMKSTIDEAVDALKEQISRKLPECNCQIASSSLKSEFYASIDRNGPELMSAFMKSLEIPPNILLPEDAVQERQYSDQEIKDIRQGIIELKNRYLYNVQLKKVLRAESNVLDCLKVAAENVQEWQERNRRFSDEFNSVKNAVSSLITTIDQRFDVDVNQQRTDLSSASKISEH